MSFSDFPEDMESEFANYLGEDPSTFPNNGNLAASAPVDSVGQSSYNSSGSFDWNQFLEAEGVERYSSPEIDWEWDAREGNFVGVGIGPPSTVDEDSSEEPAQSSGQDQGAHTIVESEKTNEQPVATTSEPEPQPEENIPNDDSLFGEGNIDDNESPVLNTGENLNDETVAVDTQPQDLSKQDQEEKADIPDDDSLFGDSTSNDIEFPKINEERQSEVVAQGVNGTPELVADTSQHSDSATSALITPDVDLNNVNADVDNDSLFGESDDNFQSTQEASSKGNFKLQAAVSSQAVDTIPAEIPSDDLDDLFGDEFGANFEAELEAGIKKDGANAVAPAVPKNIGLHLPKPPRKVSKRRELHLPDPPRAIANPQGLHLPEPPQKSADSRVLHLPDPPLVVASSQEPKVPVPPPHVQTDPEQVTVSNSPPETVTQQSGADMSAQAQMDDQDDPDSTRNRRVRASRIPKSDMSRPKGRGQAGKVLTQLSGPAPSKLQETEPSSSSGADDTAENPTRLPRWAFGKYGSFGKPVAGSKYRKPDNSANNPIRVEDEPGSADKIDEVNPENQNVSQPAPEIPGTIDLTNDTEDHIAAESSIQDNQNVNHTNGQDFAQSYANFQPPLYGDQEFGQSEGSFPTAPESSFMPILNDPNPASKLQTHQYDLALAPNNASIAVLQHQALQHPTMEGNPIQGHSIAGGIPFVGTNAQYQLQASDVHGTSRTDFFLNNVHQSPYSMDQTGVHHAASIPQPIQNADYVYGNYEAANFHGQDGGMVQSNIPTQVAIPNMGQSSQNPAMSANEGDKISSGLNENRPKKRHSHERAEFGDPRVLLTYSEFKQIFPLEPTRGCFEVAIQKERAADAAIIARGGVPQQRPTIRKAIICTWSQVQHLNRIRSATGEKLFELKPKAHKRPAALLESMRRKRKERGETSESEQFDMEPEPKRLRLAQEPTQMVPAPREQYGERTSQITSIQPDNGQKSADVSHPPFNQGITQGLYSQNIGQTPSMQIHQPVAQSFKRKLAPEQLESFESMEQEMRPQAKRPRIAPQMGRNMEPENNQSLAKRFQDYVSQRQSEYLKLRVPELRQLCSTRDLKHGRFNQLTKGGLVGVLVGQDVSRHPVYSQIHNQARAGLGYLMPSVGQMGGMDPPPIPMNHDQQQLRAPNGFPMPQNPTRPTPGPVYGMGGNYHKEVPSPFPPIAGHNAQDPIAMGNVNNAQPSRNVGPAQQPLMNASVPGLANNRGQPLTNAIQPPIIGQPSHTSMANQSRGNVYPQSRLPVNGNHNDYNNSGIQQNVNGGRNNHANANAQVPAHSIYGGFGNGVYRPAVDDRRRKPRIQGQDAPSSIPQGSQTILPQPAPKNTGSRLAGSQQPMFSSENPNGGHQEDTLGGSRIPRPVPSGNMTDDPRRFIVDHTHSSFYPAPMHGPPQGVYQQHTAAPRDPQPYLGRPPGNPYNGQPPGPAPPG
ncbi:hypothetical protein ACHAPG_006411 [Botrytis cinerea]